MHAKQLIKVLFVLLLTAGFTWTALAGPPNPPDKKPEVPETMELTLDDLDLTEITTAGQIPYAPNGQGYVNEIEPNGTVVQATSLGTGGVTALGNVYPNADEDYYSFTANAGDRVYAAVMTSFSANASSDSQLYLYDVDGVTQLEFDDDDGSLGGLSSTIAGKTLPSTGTYYLRVKHFSATGQLRPYYLHVRVQSGVPTAEVEPNDTPATANVLPAGGWVSGARDPALATEQDWFSFSANAGDTIFLSLDLDPERDTVTWNGRLGIALFGDAANQILVVDDANAGAVPTNPPSEGMFMTVKDAGTYYAFVDSATAATGGPTATYTLSVTVFPAVNEGASCTTYTSTNVPIVIGPGTGLVSSTITVPGNPRIADLDVSIQLDHTLMGDIDAHLRSPQGNDNGLFTDIGASAAGGQTQMDVIFDDEAGIPPLYTVLKGLVIKPELAYRLSWFDGEDAGGTWTLDLRDDGANANGGNLTGWSITVCEPVPPPVCPPGTTQTTLYSNDFEADDGGFTHSGTLDEWERGLPTFVPITTCNSGTSCWKTDLDNTYDASNSQNLLSPNINLVGNYTSVWLTWAQKSQVESASFDHATTTVQQVGGANPRTLWQWLDATQTSTVGNPGVTIQESSGWGQFTADISDYIGQNVEFVYHLDAETSVQLAGYAVDDVSVTGCMAVPEISLTKTVGTDPSVCAVTDNIAVAPGTDVTYCYEVTNTGLVTLTQHTLVDNELGMLLNDFPYTLSPGASAFLTATVNITETTVNTGTWTAYNPGPIDTASATDTATVSVISPEPLVCNAAAVTFDAGIPSDWSVVDNTGSSPVFWSDLATCGEGGNYTGGSGDPACASSDIAGPAEFDTELWSSPFDLSGYNSVTLDYLANYQNFAALDFLDVDISTDSGTSWTNLLSWNEDHGTFRATPGVSVALDLSAYAGQNNLVLRWHYYDPNSGDYDWYAQVDDIALTCQNVQNPPVIEVSPDSLSNTQPPDTVITQTLTISNVGEADLNWSIAEDDQVTAPVSGPTTRQGSPTPRTVPLALPATPLGVIVGDGSFEAGTPNPVWAEASTNFGTPLCDSACGFGNGTGPHTGAWWAWFGGIATFEEGSVSQNVTIPNGTATLTFWLEVPVACDSTADYLEVLVDGVQVYLVDGTYASCGVVGYALQTVDISAYADDGSHSLEFHSEIFATNGSGTNFFVDDVAIDVSGPPPVCSAPADLPWVSVSPTSGTTAPASSDDISVVLDSTGLNGGVYTGTLCITSDDPLNPLVTVPITLTVEAYTYGVELSGDDAASGVPGMTVSYVVAITNTGNTTDTFDLTASGVWNTGLSDASVTLGAGESTTFSVDVDIPAGAQAGENDVTTITATSQGDGSSTDTTLLTTSADAVYGVVLSADQVSAGAPGDTVTYVVTITNTGNTTDTFDLAAAGVWTAVLSDTSLTLGVGESTTVTVDVTIPAGATDGDSDATTVTATSQNDATATDSVTLTTTAAVEGYFIYLPIVVRPSE